MPLPVFLVAALISFLASDWVAWWYSAIWMTAVTVILFVRFYVLKHLPGWTSLPISFRVRVALWLSFLNGACHSLSFLFFPYLPEVEQALITLVIASLGTGAIATTGGHRGIFLAYMIPTMGGLVLTWGATAFYPEFDQIKFWIFVLLIFFAYVQYSLSKDAYRMFKASFDIRSQQDALNKKLEQALQSAESANAAKTRFLAAASHDLRQPIHTLSLLSTSLSLRPLDQRSREISEHMDMALEALATQLDALLDISKLDACIIDVNKTNMDLAALCHRIVNDYAATARSKGLHIKCRTTERAVVITDPLLLERIIRNLVSNAIKYTNEGEIQVTVSGGVALHYEITISDTGIGIAPEEQSLVFEEFYQSHNRERDRSKGLGLGLSIVKRLTKLLGVDLKMSSTLNQGTTMTLTLKADDSTVHTLKMDSSREIDWQGLRVLVVDDEPMIRFGMEALLSELGAEILLADGSSEAIRLAKQNCPDLVLADFRLKGDDSGLNVIQAIKALCPSAFSLLVSGDTGPDRLQEAKNMGVPLLHKPVSLHDLNTALFSGGVRIKKEI